MLPHLDVPLSIGVESHGLWFAALALVLPRTWRLHRYMLGRHTGNVRMMGDDSWLNHKRS